MEIIEPPIDAEKMLYILNEMTNLLLHEEAQQVHRNIEYLALQFSYLTKILRHRKGFKIMKQEGSQSA